MDLNQLRELDGAPLAEYLWRRLRREPPMDPPPATRFGDEPPEQIFMEAADPPQGIAFRARLIGAVRENLRRLVDSERASGQPFWADPVADEQVASLAFLVADLEGNELVDDLYRVVCSWTLTWPSRPANEISFGQMHLVRTLAMLQEGANLARFWEELWHKGPRWLRGMVFFGWARAYPEEALEHLGELIDQEEAIDLPTTLWSIIGPRGPGLAPLAEHSRGLPADKRHKVRSALETAGAQEHQLRDFDFLSCEPPVRDGFPFGPDTLPRNEEAARALPAWNCPAPA